MIDKIYNYFLLMRLNKPIGIYLLMWPMLWASFISVQGNPDIFIVILFLIGVVLTRSAGCVINDYFDKDIDKKVSRTKDRVMAKGLVQPVEAILLFISLISLCTVVLLMIGLDIIVYALISFGLLVIYPLSKRIIKIPQLILGIAFGSSVPMAYIAQLGYVDLSCLLIFLSTIFWAIAYDTYYAIADKKDDIKIGNKSSAVLFGDNDIHYPFIFHSLSIILLVLVGIFNNLNFIYYFSLMIAFLFAIYQKILVSRRIPYQCISAFENNNFFGLIIFFGLILNYLNG